MAKEVSQILQQFKDKATSLCHGEMKNQWPALKGSRFSPFIQPSLSLWGQQETCEWRRGCFQTKVVFRNVRLNM